MRIISGKYRGRGLVVPKGRKVRPTGDRMKESMFSSLNQAYLNARVLDLFAGSGALGLEALSRGASEVIFVDRERNALVAIEQNIKSLGVEHGCKVFRAEVFSYIRSLGNGTFFDLVFADPPFAGNSAQEILSSWTEGRPASSILVLEYSAKSPPESPAGFSRVVKTGHFGESSYSIYQRFED
jgi:16S rRNA (guanine966-N2)-methyltransferase